MTKRLVAFISIAIVFILISGCVATGSNPFLTSKTGDLITINSKDVGWTSIDTTITEKERSDRTSLLEVSTVTKATGMDGRFFLSFVLRLAKFRGFRYMIYSKGIEKGDNTLEMLAVFFKSEHETIEDILGDQYTEYSFEDVKIDTEQSIGKAFLDNCGF